MRKTRRGKLKRQKSLIVIRTFCMLLFLSVGYAAFSTTVRLNAKGNIRGPREVYTVDGRMVKGNELDESFIQTYPSCSATGHNACLKYTIKNNKISDRNVCFVYNNSEYCLDEYYYDASGTDVYTNESVINTMVNNHFGSNQFDTYCTKNGYSVQCGFPSFPWVISHFDDTGLGSVSVMNEQSEELVRCMIPYNGVEAPSYCSISKFIYAANTDPFTVGVQTFGELENSGALLDGCDSNNGICLKYFAEFRSSESVVNGYSDVCFIYGGNEYCLAGPSQTEEEGRFEHVVYNKMKLENIFGNDLNSWCGDTNQNPYECNFDEFHVIIADTETRVENSNGYGCSIYRENYSDDEVYAKCGFSNFTGE